MIGRVAAVMVWYGEVGHGKLWRLWQDVLLQGRFGAVRRSGQVLVGLGQAKCVKAVELSCAEVGSVLVWRLRFVMER